MKKILLFIGFVFIAFSCDQFENTASFPEFVQWKKASASIDENSTTPLTIEVQLVGTQKGSATPITFEITDNNVTEDVDYKFPNGKSLEIAANASSATLTLEVIDNSDFLGEDRFLILNLISAGNLSVGDDTSPNKSIKITIIEDDCPVPSLVGTYSVETLNTNPAGCDGVTNSVDIVSSGSNSYTLSDVTGGLYKNCYGAADNQGEITINGFAITMVDQPDVVYGGDIFNGTGVINCDGSFSLTWSNGYGDSGTSYFTK